MSHPDVPGLLRAADHLDFFLTWHPGCEGGLNIYHLKQELLYIAENPVEDDE